MLKLKRLAGDAEIRRADGAVIDIGLIHRQCVTGTIPLPLFPPGLWFLTPLKTGAGCQHLAGDVLSAVSVLMPPVSFSLKTKCNVWNKAQFVKTLI